jgi:hypothetical protein
MPFACDPSRVRRALIASSRGNTDVTTYFCDGLKDVTIVNSVARLEFFLTKSDSLRLEMRPPNIERPQAVARPESD